MKSAIKIQRASTQSSHNSTLLLACVTLAACVLQCATVAHNFHYRSQHTPSSKINNVPTQTRWPFVSHRNSITTFSRGHDTIDPAKQKSLEVLCLLLLKLLKVIVELACLCFLVSCLFLMIFSFLSLLIPLFIASLFLAFLLIPVVVVTPVSQALVPVVPTIPPVEPPFTSIPARKS